MLFGLRPATKIHSRTLVLYHLDYPNWQNNQKSWSIVPPLRGWCQLYVEFDPASSIPIKSALSRLTKFINDIKSWMTCNKLKLNNDKTKFFIVLSPHNKRRMPNVKLQIGQEEIIPSATVRNLGIILYCQMSLARSVTYHLRNISLIRHFLDFDTCNNVIGLFVLSRLDYGNVLLMEANDTDIARLQRLQNWASKLIFLASKKDHATHFLKQLDWLPVKQRVQFKVLLYVFKCLADSAPAYLTSSLELCKPVRGGLRSATDTTRLMVPKIYSRTFKSEADKAFCFSAPRLWNRLPISVRTSISIGLKTHMFAQV